MLKCSWLQLLPNRQHMFRVLRKHFLSFYCDRYLPKSIKFCFSVTLMQPSMFDSLLLPLQPGSRIKVIIKSSCPCNFTLFHEILARGNIVQTGRKEVHNGNSHSVNSRRKRSSSFGDAQIVFPPDNGEGEYWVYRIRKVTGKMKDLHYQWR